MARKPRDLKPNYCYHNEGITQWHQAFLEWGRTLEECAAKYRRFCQKYRPQAKPEKRNHWGSRFLPSVIKGGKAKKSSPGQIKPTLGQAEGDGISRGALGSRKIYSSEGIGFMKC